MKKEHIYLAQRARERLLRDELVRFALWNSPIWDEENEDDIASALKRVDSFLAGEEAW